MAPGVVKAVLALIVPILLHLKHTTQAHAFQGGLPALNSAQGTWCALRCRRSLLRDASTVTATESNGLKWPWPWSMKSSASSRSDNEELATGSANGKIRHVSSSIFDTPSKQTETPESGTTGGTTTATTDSSTGVLANEQGSEDHLEQLYSNMTWSTEYFDPYNDFEVASASSPALAQQQSGSRSSSVTPGVVEEAAHVQALQAAATSGPNNNVAEAELENVTLNRTSSERIYESSKTDTAAFTAQPVQVLQPATTPTTPTTVQTSLDTPGAEVSKEGSVDTVHNTPTTKDNHKRSNDESGLSGWDQQSEQETQTVVGAREAASHPSTDNHMQRATEPDSINTMQLPILSEPGGDVMTDSIRALMPRGMDPSASSSSGTTAAHSEHIDGTAAATAPNIAADANDVNSDVLSHPVAVSTHQHNRSSGGNSLSSSIEAASSSFHQQQPL